MTDIIRRFSKNVPSTFYRNAISTGIAMFISAKRVTINIKQILCIVPENVERNRCMSP